MPNQYDQTASTQTPEAENARLHGDADGFDALQAYLADAPFLDNRIELSFVEVEQVLGRTLPAAAYDSSARWWTGNPKDCPQVQSWLRAGFEVCAVGFQSSTEGYVVFSRGVNRWPGLVVNSTEFAKQSVDLRLRDLALGYSQAARLLCFSFGDNPTSLSWSTASPAMFCYRHAVELFLKSCIFHRSPRIEKCSHDISVLKRVYVRLYPEPEYNFETPYDFSLRDLDDLVGCQVALVEDFEYKQDQLFRYASDKDGMPPRGMYVFRPGSWVVRCERLESDINRIWTNIVASDSERCSSLQP